MKLRTCVSPDGHFIYMVHKPQYRVMNQRMGDSIEFLGNADDGFPCYNNDNFPTGDVVVDGAGWVFEIPNAWPFFGTTYISKEWADQKADHPETIALPPPCEVCMSAAFIRGMGDRLDSDDRLSDLFRELPSSVRLALAAASTSSEDLVRLARMSCDFLFDGETGQPIGLRYAKKKDGGCSPIIHDHTFFDTVANNRHLPDEYKRAMVLRPGVQGNSEIVGEYLAAGAAGFQTHVFEYLRKNSYIPGGHYAANMADDAVRYRMDDLTADDFTGLRHLYYQRSYLRLAVDLGLETMGHRHCLNREELENLRQAIIAEFSESSNNSRGSAVQNPCAAAIWGWNYGFDCAASGYRLHASHQQIHQQYAMVPVQVDSYANGEMDKSLVLQPYSCGDMVGEFIADYRQRTGSHFFKDYIHAIRNNRRLDRKDNDRESLIVYEDEHVMLFVPKAQRSQWELQLMVVRPVANILEADVKTRDAIDKAILLALRTLTGLGARMITTIEYGGRFRRQSMPGQETDQHLFYVFSPRLPESPGGFSEAQLRFINGHYPEDFAAACRKRSRVE
jgi:hypothetical protein